MFLFCDGSVHQASAQGYGAYIVTDNLSLPPSMLATKIQTRLFSNTSSTRLELQTLIWALTENQFSSSITVFTDCQNSVELLRRRERLEAKQFCSNKGVELNNADLYRAFFKLLDQMNVRVEKVKGHSPSGEKSVIETLFGLVDHAARRQCRLLSGA